jgi:hypothetical protein
VCCETKDECTPLPDPCAEAECAPGTRPLLEEAPAFDPDTCEVTPGRCGCVELDPLPLGTVGLYLDAAVAPDDRVLLSGYNSQYGDLMFGVVGQAGPAWVFVDGVPADGAVTGSVNGPRGGVAVNGPNVGRFTSLAVGSNGHVHIAYRDDANKDLKYAHGAPSADGYTFRVQTVDAEGDAGLWADLSLGADGAPGIAYMVAEVEQDGVKRSKLRWAQAGSDDPASGAWTLADLDSVDLPAEEPEGVPDLPLGVGHFASVGRLSSGAVVVAYYDRVGTDLRLVRQEGGVWGAPVILDGRDGQGVDTGDRGRWASLVVGADDQIHVAYEDFDKADLRYLNLSAQVSELVDDGVRVLPNNGVSIRRVGAGARLLLGPDGLPRVAYQDATEHALLLARKDAQGQWSLLTVAGLEEPYKGSYGFYNGHVIVGGQSVMATFRYNRTSNPASNGVDLFRF